MWVGPLSPTHAQDRQPGSCLSFTLLLVHLMEAISTRRLVVSHAAISPFSRSGLLSPLLYFFGNRTSVSMIRSLQADVLRKHETWLTILQSGHLCICTCMYNSRVTVSHFSL